MELIQVKDNNIIAYSAQFISNKLHYYANQSDKPLLLGVSGGGSPKALYPVLSDMISAQIASRMIIIQIDERIISPTHADSNQNLIYSTMNSVLEKGAKFYAMPTDSTDLSNCVQYEKLITPLFNGEAIPAVALLGVGEDGHTASIFPDQIMEIPNDSRLVFMTPRKKNDYYRMSLSFTALFAMNTTILYAPGKNKSAIIEAVSNPNNIEQYPAAKVIQNHPDSYILATKTD